MVEFINTKELEKCKFKMDNSVWYIAIVITFKEQLSSRVIKTSPSHFLITRIINIKKMCEKNSWEIQLAKIEIYLDSCVNDKTYDEAWSRIIELTMM